MPSSKPVLSVVERLQYRASLYSTIRAFFRDRKVLEVETPIFSPFANTDPNIQSLPAQFTGQLRYAHTSPEFAMKKLLCQGSGDIFQICKVFRLEEEGRLHQQEFSMLEWYRIGMDYRQLAGEVLELLNAVGIKGPTGHSTYRDLFLRYLSIDISNADAAALKGLARKEGITHIDLGDDVDAWLSLLLTHCIEPRIINTPILVIYDFPRSQAALAKLSDSDQTVALRFEIYVKGIELANGYQELTDAVAYQRRFEVENQVRVARASQSMPIDEGLVTAIQAGLPECSGVALGIDRLLMLLSDQASLSDIM